MSNSLKENGRQTTDKQDKDDSVPAEHSVWAMPDKYGNTTIFLFYEYHISQGDTCTLVTMLSTKHDAP